jgi:hypothetical protein
LFHAYDLEIMCVCYPNEPFERVQEHMGYKGLGEHHGAGTLVLG